MNEHHIEKLYARSIPINDGLVAPYGGELVQAFVPAHLRPSVLERLSSLPRLQISAAELLDLEMIAAGALSPLNGYMTQSFYTSVLAQASLPDGRPWGLPVTLAVTRAAKLSIRAGQEAALYYGQDPVGVIQVEDVFPWEAQAEARALWGVNDLNHPRIAQRLACQAAYLVGGPVAFLAARTSGLLPHKHQWPIEVRAQVAQHGWRQVAVPHLQFPWRRTDEYLLKCALEASDALLLHVPVDKETAPQCIPQQVLAVASRLLIENYFPVDRVMENPISADLFANESRAALQHAILSQNYGASLFFIPESGAISTPEVRELLAKAVRYGLAIRPVFMPAAFHCEACGGVATEKSCPHTSGQRVFLADEDIYKNLLAGESLLPMVTRPDIARSMARSVSMEMDVNISVPGGRNIFPHATEVSSELRHAISGHKACVLWMTGLSGSGKSTIAHRLERELLLSGHSVLVLDGDTLRHGLNKDLGFSQEARRENLRRAGEVTRVMLEAGMIVIASFISPLRAERDMARRICGSKFFEVYVQASLEDCEIRDPKGLYKRARAGLIPQFTGISSPYEQPENPELLLNTTAKSLDECVRLSMDFMVDKGLLRISNMERSRTRRQMDVDTAVSTNANKFSVQ